MAMNVIKAAKQERVQILERLERNKDYQRLLQVDKFLEQFNVYNNAIPETSTRPMAHKPIANVPKGLRSKFVYDKIVEELKAHAMSGGDFPVTSKQLSMKLSKHGITVEYPSAYVLPYLREEGSLVTHQTRQGWYWNGEIPAKKTHAEKIIDAKNHAIDARMEAVRAAKAKKATRLSASKKVHAALPNITLEDTHAA